jgi:hypothetical protein
VLQRIALCYGTVTVLFLATSTIVQRVVMLCFTAIYVGLMYGLDVPKCGTANATSPPPVAVGHGPAEAKLTAPRRFSFFSSFSLSFFFFVLFRSAGWSTNQGEGI